MRKSKVLISVLLFVLVASSAFAYDGTVYGDSIGKFSRKEFIETASDLDYAAFADGRAVRIGNSNISGDVACFLYQFVADIVISSYVDLRNFCLFVLKLS